MRTLVETGWEDNSLWTYLILNFKVNFSFLSRLFGKLSLLAFHFGSANNHWPPGFSSLQWIIICCLYWDHLVNICRFVVCLRREKYILSHLLKGFRSAASGKESACQCRRQQGMGVWSLGQEDPLEGGTATHSSILAWRSHGQRSLGGCSAWDCKESDLTKAT